MTTDAKEPEVIRALRRVLEDNPDAYMALDFNSDAYVSDILGAWATLTQQRDNARTTSQYWKDEKLASEREIDTLTRERDDARRDAARLRGEAFAFLNYVESQQCLHEETHRGGAIWEICDMCGSKWADDEGGKPEWSEPKVITRFRAAIDAARTADAGEG